MALFDDVSNSIGIGEFNYAYNISLKHRYLYIENAKAACTTTKYNLSLIEFHGTGLGGGIQSGVLDNIHANVIGTPFIKPFQLPNQFFDKILNDDSYIRFTFVRNPFTRILSAYLDKIVRRLPEAKEIYQTLNRTDNEDIAFVDFLRAIHIRTKAKQPIDKHWRPQSIQCPEYCRLNQIGRIENFDNDFRRIMKSIGFTIRKIHRVDSHATNASSHISNLYTDECINLVVEIYHQDFELFGYKKELSNALNLARLLGAAPTAPDFSSVSLLLKGDGTNGCTSFLDSSSSPKTMTANGNAQISTSVKKYGAGSIALDGSGDYLTAASDTSLQLPTQDFTIECWFYLNALPTAGATMVFVQKGIRASANFEYRFGVIDVAGTTRPTFAYSTDGSVVTLRSATFGSIAVKTWNHVAVTRVGATLRFWLNGVELYIGSGVAATLCAGSGTFSVGATSGGGSPLNGYIDDLRITKGVARYTASFTPPTAAFPVGHLE